MPAPLHPQAAKFLAATGISVKFTPYVATDYNALLSTALTAGKGPDVMQMRAYGEWQIFLMLATLCR